MWKLTSIVCVYKVMWILRNVEHYTTIQQYSAIFLNSEIQLEIDDHRITLNYKLFKNTMYSCTNENAPAVRTVVWLVQDVKVTC